MGKRTRWNKKRRMELRDIWYLTDDVIVIIIMSMCHVWSRVCYILQKLCWFTLVCSKRSVTTFCGSAGSWSCRNLITKTASLLLEFAKTFSLSLFCGTHYPQAASRSSLSPTCNRGLVFSLHIVEQLLEVAAIVAHPQAIANALKKSTLSTFFFNNISKS